MLAIIASEQLYICHEIDVRAAIDKIDDTVRINSPSDDNVRALLISPWGEKMIQVIIETLLVIALVTCNREAHGQPQLYCHIMRVLNFDDCPRRDLRR